MTPTWEFFIDPLRLLHVSLARRDSPSPESLHAVALPRLWALGTGNQPGSIVSKSGGLRAQSTHSAPVDMRLASGRLVGCPRHSRSSDHVLGHPSAHDRSHRHSRCAARWRSGGRWVRGGKKSGQGAGRGLGNAPRREAVAWTCRASATGWSGPSYPTKPSPHAPSAATPAGASQDIARPVAQLPGVRPPALRSLEPVSRRGARLPAPYSDSLPTGT